MVSVFFFNDTATTEIYTLSLHDALPISRHRHRLCLEAEVRRARSTLRAAREHDAAIHRMLGTHGSLTSAQELELHARRGARRRIDEQVREQRAAGLDAVGPEVPHAGLVEHAVVDEELPGALARRPAEDHVGGVRHDLRLA